MLRVRKVRTVVSWIVISQLMLSMAGCGGNGGGSGSTQAKHVILIIGDGMQLEHERAASNYLFGTPEGSLRHQKFDYQGAVSTWDLTTYNRYAYTGNANLISDSAFDPQDTASFSAPLGYDPGKGGKLPFRRDSGEQVAYFGTKLKSSASGTEAYPGTDSASAGTALSTGFKTDDGNIAWRNGDPENGRLTTIAEMYRSQRKAAIGVVTTVPFSHATPAAFVSHNKSRSNYKAIAQEIITSVRPEVVIGGGHPGYNDAAGISGSNAYQYIDAPEYANLKNSTEYAFAERSAGVDGGKALMARADQAAGSGKKLFGLFGGVGGNFEYHTPSNDGSSIVTRGSIENPTLADASTAALKVLSKNSNGFFLMVEQGDIDWANHANNYSAMIGGIWDLNNAVQAIEAYVDQPGDDITWDNTLVIVTSDHGNSYMRLAKDLAKGKLPTQTPNGSGAPSGYDPSVAYYYDPSQVTYGFSGLGMNSHTNELVTLYARGAGSKDFGTYEGLWYPGTRIVDNTQIYRVMLTAMNLADENRSMAAQLDATVFTLADTSLKLLNPLLTDQELTDAITNGGLTTVKPGIGSGLTPDPKMPGSYYMLTDRGMNGKTGAKFFPLPSFTPTIAKVHFDAGGTIVVDRYIPILDRDGNYAGGLPNLAGIDDVPYTNAGLTSQVPYNQSGIDSEDLQLLPNGDFLIVDEYSPSILVVDGSSGRIRVRYTPVNRTLPSATYTVKNILPAILEQRRSNRGFENLALSSDGRTAYAVMQSPMGDKSLAQYKTTRVVRILRLDMSDPVNASVTGHFVVLQSPVSDYAKNIGGYSVSNKQTDMKYSAAQWLSKDRILLLERANGKAKLMAVDMTHATNLMGKAYENSLGPEDVSTSGQGLAGLGIVPAATLELFSSDELKALVDQTVDRSGATPTYEIKLEGMAIVSDRVLYLSNDNDFGITDKDLASKVWKVTLRKGLSSY